MLMTIDTTQAQFDLPPAVQARLHYLLDQQDSGVELSDIERQEAVGLVELADFLSLLKVRAERVEQVV